MATKDYLQNFTESFTPVGLEELLFQKSDQFRPEDERLDEFVHDDDRFTDFRKTGVIEYDETTHLLVTTCRVTRELTFRSSRRVQYDIAVDVLKRDTYDAGLFVFYDDDGNFRFSLIVANYAGTKRKFTNYRRYTYYVSPQLPNKTFINQLYKADFSSIDELLKAFSIDAVTDEFYNEFEPKFRELAEAVQGNEEVYEKTKRDFSLIFIIRIIFLGFVQKRGWLSAADHTDELSEDERQFIQKNWNEYRATGARDEFYTRWLKPLFFEALNTPPGGVVKYQNNEFSEQTSRILQMAPYLNGELFKEKPGVDDLSLWIPDRQIEDFFDFLFSYNFTIEENTSYDEELELNPEFLGIIFERLVNKEDGAIYTPRPEVDFMCRMSLVKWLEKNTTCDHHQLYDFLFLSGEAEGEYKEVDFSEDQIRELIQKLESVTVCDPAAGSGAFEVGMLHVLFEIFERLYKHPNCSDELIYKGDFTTKKEIIANSLYGVEVKQWAVWINHLRLWLTLFVDMPDEYRHSYEPLLPSLDFKVRQGDSLVQRIGSKQFPVQGHQQLLPRVVKRKVSELQRLKIDFFYNRGASYDQIRAAEADTFRAILDAEIEEKQKELSKLQRPRKKQGELIPDGRPEQGTLDMDYDHIEQLKSDIGELTEQRRQIGRDHPLIWNIEFAEIFFHGRTGFDIIIGNPPYVRQESISDPAGNLEPGDYKAHLKEMLRIDFPEYFKNGTKVAGRSDLYTYFYVRSLRLLNGSGIHVFICSNSWLDVGYGVWLQHFLLRNTPVHQIVDNHAKRSFANADINTIISIIDAPGNGASADHPVKFTAFRKPLEAVLVTEHLKELEEAEETIATEDYRVYPQTVGELIEQGSEFENEEKRKLGAGTYVGDKWGNKFLRAPDIYFIVTEKGKKYINHLKNFVDGERYLNTGGADNFFIITDFSNNNDGTYFIKKTGRYKTEFSGNIEKKYLKPLIKNIHKSTRNIEIDEYDALCLVPAIEEPLSKNLKKYIQWGEENNFHQRSVTKLQKPWYKPTNQMLSAGEILIPRSFNETFVIHTNPQKYLSLRLYRFHLKNIKHSILSVYLNSTLFILFLETLGNKSLGQGALDFFMKDTLSIKIPIILHDSFYNIYKKISNRKINNIFIECGINPNSDVSISKQDPNPLPDRAELDNIIFDELGLDDEERKEVYRAVCQLVWNRLSKARSV